MDPETLIGAWDIGWGREFTIEQGAESLLVRFPEAPPGFEARLVDAGEGHLRMLGGPYPEAELHLDGDGLSVGGVIPVRRLDRPAQVETGWGLRAPALELTRAEVRRCEELWAHIDHPSRQLDIDPGALGPGRFVQWLMAHDLVVFHGSNRADIEELVPERRSMELANVSGRGNLGAVYGTHDGLWAMFFAVIRREGLAGSIRNGVDTHWSGSGERLDLYHFSIHHELLPERPFTTGALYLLPRDRFRQLPLYPGGPPFHEWACEGSVRPLARLRVEPDDFPFLDQIGGHDDGMVFEFEVVAGAVYDAVVAAREIEGGIELVTTAALDEVGTLVDLGRRLYPDVERSVEPHPDGIRLRMVGPPGFRQTIRARFADLMQA